jgi:MFS family permease
MTVVDRAILVTALDPRRWWALALLCGAFFMVILDASIVIIALPSIESDLGFSKQGLQWVVSAYAVTFAGLLLLGGRAADLLGRRRVLMVGIVLFTAASPLCGLAWSPAALIAARALQGVGAAIMTPTALSIISTTFPEGRERNKALGIWSMMGAIGSTAGWLIGGALIDMDRRQPPAPGAVLRARALCLYPRAQHLPTLDTQLGIECCPVLLHRGRTNTAQFGDVRAGAALYIQNDQIALPRSVL